MRNMRRLFSGFLAVLMLMTVPAFAAVEDTGFSDVAADIWYAGAVEYVRDSGLMSGTSTTTFAPDTNTSRAMLATILYRASGSPAVTGAPGFTDVAPGAWYADAVIWAAENGVVSGYGNGLFGANDPVTREQIATILWRYAGSPAAEAGQDFTDESAIASYAATAVDWARANGVVSGLTDGRFDPKGNATRAQVATILRNYMTMDQGGEEPSEGKNVLVAYFSASGNTEAVAETIADTLNADIFELTPTDPYTSAALDWNAPGSRVNDEHDDPALRDIKLVADTVEGWDAYDTVFIGYPIWWGIAAWPVDSFVEANDFTDKTVIPFATSSSSGLGQSSELLEELAGSGNWQEGRRFRSGAAESDVRAWVDSLDLNTPTATQLSEDQGPRSLVAYFSMPETTDPNNMTTEEANSTVVIDGQVLGNTQYMAYVIQEVTGADIFRIQPETPYPTDHDTLVDLAAEEQEEGTRPAIADRVDDMGSYDVIYLGYPNWWGDMPMILYSFLEEYDMGGKTIVPFNTHGGSGFSGTIGMIRELEPDARVLDGLSISRNSIQDAEQEIINWVNSLDI